VQAGPDSNRRKSGRILVLGLGNILLADEGVGVHVARQLAKHTLPAHVEVMDGGTAALDVLLLVRDVEKLVVVDALRAGKKPGTVYVARFAGGQESKLEEHFARQDASSISLHQIGLLDALSAAKRVSDGPEEIVIIGVEPAKIDCSLQLTDEIAHKVPQIMDIVLKEIKDAVHTE
jgi:hydrogenase maturation protease